jgi:predicted RNA binding protein YcfA (HicA-like mRNA interferase family)
MLARLPGAKAKEVIRALEGAGFIAGPQKATSHVVLRDPLSKKIIKDASLTEDEFRELL